MESRVACPAPLLFRPARRAARSTYLLLRLVLRVVYLMCLAPRHGPNRERQMFRARLLARSRAYPLCLLVPLARRVAE